MPPLEKLVIDGKYLKGLGQDEMFGKIGRDLSRLQPGDIVLLNGVDADYGMYKEARAHVADRMPEFGYLLRFANPRDRGFTERSRPLTYDAEQDAYRYVPPIQKAVTASDCVQQKPE